MSGGGDLFNRLEPLINLAVMAALRLRREVMSMAIFHRVPYVDVDQEQLKDFIWTNEEADVN